MPRALTPEEKRAKVEREQNEKRGTVEEKGEGTSLQIRSAADRPQRVVRNVFNGSRGKLKVPDHVVKAFAEAGWTLRIFNDSPGRISDALTSGYEFVTRQEVGDSLSSTDDVVSKNTDPGEKIRYRVGVNDNGDGLFGFLMKIPTDQYIANQSVTQERTDLIDRAIKAGKNVKPGDSAEGFYGTVKYEINSKG